MFKKCFMVKPKGKHGKYGKKKMSTLADNTRQKSLSGKGKANMKSEVQTNIVTKQQRET